MISLLLILLTAAPPLPPLGEISAPLGHIGNVVDALPKGGVSDSDKVIAPTWEGCAEPKASGPTEQRGGKGIYLMRLMGGAGRALEQLQQSLDRAPGSEKKLFARKAVLTEVMKQLSSARFEQKVSCTAAPLGDGFKLELSAPPKKWCDAQPAAAEGEFWYFAGKSPSAVISVQKGGTDVCKPRLSTVLFDAKGVARVRLHADWGGALSATLVGDRCQLVDYTLDPDRQVFVPVWKSCKR